MPGTHALAAAEVELDAVAPAPTSFSVWKMHDRSARCWAVIAEPHGSIVVGDDGELVMKLTEWQAHALARRLTDDLRNAASPCIAGGDAV